MSDSLPTEGTARPIKQPPQSLFLTQISPNCWEARRPTPAELEILRRDYPEWCAEQHKRADREAGCERGLTASAWAAMPESYWGVCFKGCYVKRELVKGTVEEFGVRGVYVCSGCEYAFPPDCQPEKARPPRTTPLLKLHLAWESCGLNERRSFLDSLRENGWIAPPQPSPPHGV